RAVSGYDVVDPGIEPDHGVRFHVRDDERAMAGRVGLGLVDRKPESVGRNRDASGKDSVQLQAARFQDDVLVLRLVADGDPLGGTGAPESGMNEISAGREPEHARAALGLGDERQPAVLAGLGAEDAPDEASRNI